MTTEKSGEDQPKQTTREGLEIPVPTRDEFLRNMDKVAPANPKPADDKPAKS